ncbi:hypothetical protein HYPSUDRAFT_202314 [Hypholoma sublateritium FD-334 SS-4]|uniref:Uncharacterized protein n=1 Tax=Hypholoma sublateritium (strain FD-334 SS-4) TaxID=945553 RepID=A0A0D2L602_HYPSF|nr:hypothetical protein HYPSUDRAFT_202314 [Hypholoma sublateritium FD-334 SS-4]
MTEDTEDVRSRAHIPMYPGLLVACIPHTFSRRCAVYASHAIFSLFLYGTAHVSSHWQVDVLHYLPRLAFRAVQNRHAVRSHGPHSGARAQRTFCAAALVPAEALLYARMVCMDICICASERLDTVSATLHGRDAVPSTHTGALHILSAEAAPCVRGSGSRWAWS